MQAQEKGLSLTEDYGKVGRYTTYNEIGTHKKRKIAHLRVFRGTETSESAHFVVPAQGLRTREFALSSIFFDIMPIYRRFRAIVSQLKISLF